jgi:periplasmic protein TonB
MYQTNRKNRLTLAIVISLTIHLGFAGIVGGKLISEKVKESRFEVDLRITSPPPQELKNEELTPREIEPPKPKKVIKKTRKKPVKKIKPETKKVKDVVQAPVIQPAPQVETVQAVDSQHLKSLKTSYRNKVYSKIVRTVSKNTYMTRHDGLVKVKFTINASGNISDIYVLKSSGISKLDNLALKSVKRSAPFPPIPQELELNSITFTVPVRIEPK